MLGIKFRSDKCEKMHIGNNHNSYIYGKGNVDALVDVLDKKEEGKETLKYKYTGKVQNC